MLDDDCSIGSGLSMRSSVSTVLLDAKESGTGIFSPEGCGSSIGRTSVVG